MNRRVKTSHRVIAIFFTLNFLTTIVPINSVFASNNGPNAPEASAFEPVNATDMVNLSSGDMSYVLPLLEIDGFPVTLSYHAGIPMDMEASWVGLGWNINTGAIARGVVANPDDWGLGRRLNLTYLYGETEQFSINVGVGLAKAADVGVGLSWGSNKSLSGSVSASIGPASASIDTNGNYSVGISTNGWGKGTFSKIGSDPNNGGFGGSLSISGNVKKGGIAVNVGVGGATSEGLSASMGVSISSQGVGSSFSVGKGNNTSGSAGRSGGAGISMNSFSAGDFSYNTKGFFIPLQIGIFSFGFGYSKTEIELANAYNKYAYGILYHDSPDLYETNLGEDVLTGSSSSGDYQRRNTFGDVYEQELPQTEEDFVGDYRNQVEKLNFTFGGYDSYDINATGIGGALKPIIGQNTVLIGEGYDGTSIRDTNKKTKVFYHNANGANSGLIPNKSISLSNNNPNKLNFSFDGQITENAIVSGSNIINYSGSTIDLDNFVSPSNSLSSRPKSGSYVEVFTNQQINTASDVYANNVLIPSSLKTGGDSSVGSIPRTSQGYIPEGIGGYKITTPDGKAYHFMQPVYQYEQIQHSFLNFDDVINESEYNSSSKRDATPYATHWLLTAITGPDFIDANGNNYPDEADYGYWLRLDHGQWSNAYVWRSPHDNTNFGSGNTGSLKKNYSTYIDNEVEKSDPGYFMQGRKDLYYLDKIVSKNQTAYFVKDIRHDAYGTSADYIFNPTDVDWTLASGYQIGPTEFNDPIEPISIYGQEHAKYDKEYQLKLDKIIITNNKNQFQNIDPAYSSNIQGISPYERSISDRYPFANSFFRQNMVANNQLPHKLHMIDNIIDVNDVVNFDYDQASKVIQFNHSYDLAKETPSSGFPSNAHSSNSVAGRLTLESVKTYGRNMLDYMPPYVFDYINRDATHQENHIDFNTKEYIRAEKDNWGFRQNNIEAWSLKSITTPQGAEIEVTYEEDDFYVEAFSRRFWNKNLAFKVVKISNDEYEVRIQNHVGIDPNALINDFNDYFEIGSKVYMDFYLCMGDKDNDTSDHARGAVDIRTDDTVSVKSITNDPETGNQVLVLKVLDTGNAHLNTPSTQGVYGDTGYNDNAPNLPLNKWLDDVGDYPCNLPFVGNAYCPYGSDSFWAKRINGLNRGQCPGDGAVRDHGYAYNLKYKLLANKVPPGKSGGGLKVTEIKVKDNLGSEYITRYNYNDPFRSRTSGITSFNPIRGEVFVPYQNELPGPGVMYEWVTMTAIEKIGSQEKEVGKVRYHYYTLKPYFAIFNPNIEMKDIDGDVIFKAEVEDINMSFNSLTAKDMKIEKNLSKIGQLISIEEFNEVGQLMNKTLNTYQPRLGEISETFTSMKSVFDFTENDDYVQTNFNLQKHLLSLSTKSEKVSVLKKVENITPVGKSSVEYLSADPWLGTYTSSKRTLSDGSTIYERKVPAYTKYPLMGSKIENPINKNMLTQETMSITSLGNSTINASITTWKNNWDYRNVDGSITNESGIWRKHKNYIWKDDVDPDDGTYLTAIGINSNYFDWVNNEPEDTDLGNKWQNVSTITEYTRWSSPIETKDINGNFASSKMSDNYSKVIASGNASLDEMHYSGMEYLEGGNYLDPEIIGASYRSNEMAHTGKYSAKLNVNNAVAVDLNHGQMSSGKYKLSVWASISNYGYLKFKKGSSTESFNGETVFACDWVQLNHYFDIPENNTNQEYGVVNTTSNTSVYVDDFRIHPVYSSMNSYVYDQDTDELTYVLGANNMATKFVYDKAGRLYKTYQEIENPNSKGSDLVNGGFKLLNKYRYNYKDGSDVIANWPDQEDCKCCNDNGQDLPPNGSDNETITDEPCPFDYRTMLSATIEQVKESSLMQTFTINHPCIDENQDLQSMGLPSIKWRWLIDYESKTFSDFIDGDILQQVPFTIKPCESEKGAYDKVWQVEAMIPNVDGKPIIVKEEIVEGGCKLHLSTDKWADVEISTNYNSCSEENMYSLRPYVIKPMHDNYSYTYRTFNHVTNSWSSYLPVTGDKNTFCGDSYYIINNYCKSGYSNYQTIQYRVLDNETGDFYQSNPMDIYLDCTTVSNPSKIISTTEEHYQYAESGNVVEKDANGKIINTYNINKR